MMYHALVAYADRDVKCSQFVTSELSVQLKEKLGYKLCIPEMDFTPGHGKIFFHIKATVSTVHEIFTIFRL